MGIGHVAVGQLSSQTFHAQWIVREFNSPMNVYINVLTLPDTKGETLPGALSSPLHRGIFQPQPGCSYE